MRKFLVLLLVMLGIGYGVGAQEDLLIELKEIPIEATTTETSAETIIEEDICLCPEPEEEFIGGGEMMLLGGSTELTIENSILLYFFAGLIGLTTISVIRTI